MRSLSGRAMLELTGAIVVVAGSFFITSKVLDYWVAPPGPNANVIHVVEATYGRNCQGSKTPAGSIAEIKAGNGTAFVAKACDQATESCELIVNVGQIGDPAIGCGKDFKVRWRCGTSEVIHDFHLPAEANLKKALLTCPAPQ